jgi:hypothetical protein
MAEKRKGSRILLIILALCVLGALASCCGCAGLWHFLPDMAIAAFTEDGPLKAPVVDPDPSVAPRLERALEAGGPVRLTGDDLVQLVEPWNEEDLFAFWVGVHGDDSVELDLSVWIEDIDRYLNLQVRGSCEIEHGWFTDFSVDQLEVSGWSFGQYMAGQQLAEHGNRSLADQRAQDPAVGLAMDQIEHLWVEDGAIHLELVPGGWDVWKAMSD